MAASSDIHMRPDAPGLHHELEHRRLVQQGGSHCAALAYQHQRLGVFQAYAQLPRALDIVGEGLDLMRCELLKAGELAHRVLIVINDHYVHVMHFSAVRACRCYGL